MLRNLCIESNIIICFIVALLLLFVIFFIAELRDVHFEYLHKGLKRIIPLSDDWSDNEEMVKAVLLSGTGLVLRRRNWDVVKGRVKKADVFLTR